MSLFRPPDEPRLGQVAWLFLRLLGVVYFAAFASLGLQVQGLLGPHGILPAADFLAAVAERFGGGRFLLLPSIFWLGAGSGALAAAAAGGVLLSILLGLGLAPRLVLVASWALYLSFVSVGQAFLGHQWDALLLEAGLARGVPCAGRPSPPPRP
jgi:hypothetical protein